MKRPIDLIDDSWSEILPYLNSDELVHLREKVLPHIKFYPRVMDTFKVFEMPLNKIDVVIIGQDPYYTPNAATGRAFAVPEKHSIPPSLQIMRKEIFEELQFETDILWGQPKWKTLEHWTKQGVFLYNTALTVRAGTPNSHTKYWKNFSEKVIKTISVKRPCIWLLWGKKAQGFQKFIANPMIVDKYNTEDLVRQMPLVPETNYILTASHPAAEAYNKNAGFLGCNHFNIANWILQKKYKTNINW